MIAGVVSGFQLPLQVHPGYFLGVKGRCTYYHLNVATGKEVLGLLPHAAGDDMRRSPLGEPGGIAAGLMGWWHHFFLGNNGP